MKTHLLALSLFLFVSMRAATGIHAQDTKPQHHHIGADSLQNVYQADIEKQVEDALLVAKTQLDKANAAMAIDREVTKRQIDLAMKEAQKAYGVNKIQKDAQDKAMQEAEAQLRQSEVILRKANEETLKALENIDLDAIHTKVQQAMDAVSKAMHNMEQP